MCLISQDPLEVNHVKLDCGHKFNYKELYNEVKMQKTSPTYTEVQRLRREQLKCPYCRNVQVGLLPRRKGFENVNGVNTPYKFIMKRQKCKYVFQSGKRKGNECGVASVDRFCVKCHKLYEKRKSKMVCVGRSIR